MLRKMLLNLSCSHADLTSKCCYEEILYGDIHSFQLCKCICDRLSVPDILWDGFKYCQYVFIFLNSNTKKHCCCVACLQTDTSIRPSYVRQLPVQITPVQSRNIISDIFSLVAMQTTTGCVCCLITGHRLPHKQKVSGFYECQTEFYAF